ncbi:MAG: M60 family metallopeptidase [Prevotella sp.]|jgi:hypothetical protein|nr:M60 family metallopeptidase [Prevotella sp.]
MKNKFNLPLLAFLCMFSLFFTQCSDEQEKVPSLEVGQNDISFVQAGESKSISVIANNSWSYKVSNGDEKWLTLSKSDEALNITAKINEDASLRKATITITSAGLSETVNVSQFGKNIEIIPSTGLINLLFSDKEFDFIISSNAEYEIIIEEGATWLKEVEKPEAKSSGSTDKTHYFETEENFEDQARSANLTIKQVGGNKQTTVKVSQKAYNADEEPPLPVDDIKIALKSVWASSEHSGDPISKAVDDDLNSFWHSEWGTSTWPITAVFYFDEADYIDYLTYTPRTDHRNGRFKEFNLYVSYTQNPNRDNADHWELYDVYDFEGSGDPSDVEFRPALENPTAIKFEILSGDGDNSNGFASCVDMSFYKKRTFDVDLTRYFVDDICSAVKPGITKEEILASEMPHFFKSLALQMLDPDNEYSSYKINDYQAYRPVEDLAKELKTSTYNQYENPTGIWFEEGKDIYVLVSDTRGEKIALKLRNWTTETTVTFPLKKGINLIRPTFSGQTYINYFTANYKTAEPIKLHIAGGQINGYFDRNKNTAEEWTGILTDAAGDHLDIIGDYTNLIFHIPSLKRYCPTEGMRLIKLYDEIIEMQFDQMGLFKYDRVPKNHMLGRNMPDGFMHADGIGAAFNNNTMNSIGSPSAIVQGDNNWGIAHEYGHVNQIRPGLKWVGTAECTNNIYSSYAQYMLTSKYSKLHLRLEHEDNICIEGGPSVIGGRFNCHLHYGVLKGHNWLFQWGQDGESDHFVKLVPMWQLNLYFKVAENTLWYKPDWFGDISEDTRNADDINLTHGEHQMNFIKRACEHTETDLTEFFEKAGLLKPIDKEIDDYGKARLLITDEMCNEVKNYVRGKGWAKPEGIINYISGNTVSIYANRYTVSGILNQGVSGSGTTRTVSHSVWKNAVVYETYAGDNLERITMAGTGTTDNSSTIVPYPSGSTKIVAVSWNGDRYTVFE